MEPKKAIEIIKNVIDASIKAGVIPNMENASAIIQAYATIYKTLMEEK